MKTIKDEPIEIPNSSSKTVNQLLKLYNHDRIAEQELSICAWCQQLGSQLFTLHTDNGDSKILCSEVCFNQYRRASFKKNKDPKLSKIHQIMKIKSTNGLTAEKRNKLTVNEMHHRRKFISSARYSMQSKSKPSESPLTKRHRSSSSNEKSSSTLPINLTSAFLPPPPTDINHFQYPFFTPPSSSFRPMPFSLPPRTTSSESFPSTLFPTLTKGLLSNYTCILPTFIPLPIPIPLCLPIHSSCVKCSIDVSNQECQTEISNNFSRRMSS